MEFLNILALQTVYIAFIGLSSVLASMEDLQQMKSDNLRSVDIKPGAGRQEVEDRLGDFVCKFQYKAQGGTNEQWSLSISANTATKEWLCTVERPSGISYLFFEEFKLEVSGARLKEVLIESEPGRVLQSVEYLVNKKENHVIHSPGNFKSQLSKVQVYAKKSPSKARKDL